VHTFPIPHPAPKIITAHITTTLRITHLLIQDVFKLSQKSKEPLSPATNERDVTK
jgi:hypothetical protein